jgi:two-component system, NtrC family, nitrogen regulation sensor histidine kinase NtrY
VRRALIGLAIALAAALVLVHFVQRELSTLSPALGVHPQVSSALRGSMDDLKALSRLDPSNEAEYRSRFDQVQALHNRLEILRMGQEEIARTQERILFSAVALALLVIGATYLIGRRREIERLGRIESFLGRLSAGEPNLRVGERGSDTIAKVAAMIERTSEVLAAQRQRLRYLENLSTWQEAARRHAHEIRTPLTAAQLEIDRLAREIEQRHPDEAPMIRERRESIRAELDRLSGFTKGFTSFASIAPAKLVPIDLMEFLGEFCETYGEAWPMRIALDSAQPRVVTADRSLTRQVLVNLCSNSALAGSSTLRFSVVPSGDSAKLFAADDGKGVPEEVRERLFQPYTTTRRVGDGMGLGLAISKKIMLDQGGDLVLTSSSPKGTTFLLTFAEGGSKCS